MPGHLPSICSYSGCTVTVRDGTGRCPKHPRTPWVKRRDQETRTVQGAEYIRQRRELLERQPLCAVCLRNDRIRLAVIRDHIIPVSQGGPDTPENTQGLCTECHDRKSELERQVGLVKSADLTPEQVRELAKQRYRTAPVKRLYRKDDHAIGPTKDSEQDHGTTVFA